MRIHLPLIVALALSSAATGQSIRITNVPPYGSRGSIDGVVRGVDFARHRVLVYIHVEGAGWFSKPFCSSQLVRISSTGTFATSVTTGGLDHFATIFAAALVPAGFQPRCASGTGRIPDVARFLAIDHVERYGRTIRFAGRDWAVKDATLPVGPGNNRFSSAASAVRVDARGRLHLALRRIGNEWWSAEVILLGPPLGYGTYAWTTESRVDVLDEFATLGFFVYDTYGDGAPLSRFREIDHEDSRWGDRNRATTSQAVVQSYRVPGNVARYTVPSLAAAQPFTRYFTWKPARIDFGAYLGAFSPWAFPAARRVHSSTYVPNAARSHHVPRSGRERVRINLWAHRQRGLPRGDVEVVISDFRFYPAPPLTSDRPTIRHATGGAQRLTIDAGPRHGNRGYWVLGSSTGTDPGATLAHLHLPLNPDGYTFAAASSANSSVFRAFRGTLDPAGRASAAFWLPPGLPPALIGLRLHHACVVLDGGQPVVATNPIPVTLVR